jgi:hypothetical protein
MNRDLPAELDDGEQLVLSDLINRVLDKGVGRHRSHSARSSPADFVGRDGGEAQAPA